MRSVQVAATDRRVQAFTPPLLSFPWFQAMEGFVRGSVRYSMINMVV